MQGFFRITIVLIFCFIALLANDSWALKSEFVPPSDQKFEIIQGTFSVDIQSGTITVVADERGDPILALGGNTIKANTIEYNQNTNRLEARGDVRFWQEGQILRSEKLVYNVEDQSGQLTHVRSVELSDGVYFEGEELTYRKLAPDEVPGATPGSNYKEYTMRNGTVTTNDKPVPYWFVKYDKIRVIPNYRYWASDLLFYTGSWPLAFFPYYTDSLRDKVLVYEIDVGSYSELGFGVLNHITYKPNENYRYEIMGDYFDKAGIGVGGRFTYDVPGEYGPEGYVYGYFIDQQEPDNDSIFDGEERHIIAAEYEQDLPYDMRLTGRGHRINDSEFYWDYRSPQNEHGVNIEQLEQDVVSFIDLSKAWESQSARITATNRFDPFYFTGLPYIERQPQVHFEQYPLPVFNTPVYYDFQMDFGRYLREAGQTFPINSNTLLDQTEFIDEVDRFDTELTFSYPYTMPGRITIKPWVGGRFTGYMDPQRSVDPGTGFQQFDFENEERFMLEAGFDISTRRTMEFEPWFERYQKMRWLYEPLISYGYFHPSTDLEEITEGPDVRFPYIDPVDAIRFKMHRVSALLQTKVQGQDENGFTTDFLRFVVGAEYDQMPDDNLIYDNFEFFDDFANNDDHRFSDLIQEFDIYPAPWISFGNDLRWDIEDSIIRSSYYYTRMQPIERLQLTTGLYTFKFPLFGVDEERDLTFSALFDISTKYQLYFATRYDLDESEFRRSYVGLMRDLYDFYGILRLSHFRHPTLGDDFSISLTFSYWGVEGRQGQDQPVVFY